MHFTIVFNSHESYDLSYSLLFVPVPVWQQGEREIVNPHRDYPHYRRGDLKELLNREEILSRLGPGRKQAAVVVHNSGEGRRDDLLAVQEDLMAEGFAVSMLSFAPER